MDRYQRAFELLRQQLENEEREPVAEYRSPSQLLEELDLRLGETGLDDDALFEQLAGILRFTPRTTTGRFFNQLFGGRGEFGTIGEVLAAFLNSSMYTFKAGGPQVVIEREVTDHMAGLVGFRSGDGLFTPGGSMSNFVGMLLARNAFEPTAREQGLSGRPLVLYASELAHYSIPKNAGMLGIGRENVRQISTDERGRMDPEALRVAIQADLAAKKLPFLIVGTCGTTVLGAFDPAESLADLAEEFGLWLHIDGALGGSLLLSDQSRGLLKGCDRANSFTWNAHKLMGVPLPASIILTREAGVLYDNLCQKATYLFQSDEDEYDLGTRSIQCGRRNDALKLWAAWKSVGDAGMARRIEKLLNLARYAAEKVRQIEGLSLTRAPESVNVCFEVDGLPSEDVCDRLRKEQRAMVGYGVVDDRRVIRLACVSHDLTESDLDTFFDEVQAVSRTMSSAAGD